MRCEVCTVLIGENYYYKNPYFLVAYQDKHTVCVDCYDALKNASEKEIYIETKRGMNLVNETYLKRRLDIIPCTKEAKKHIEEIEKQKGAYIPEYIEEISDDEWEDLVKKYGKEGAWLRSQRIAIGGNRPLKTK